MRATGPSHGRLHDFFTTTCDRTPGKVALEAGDVRMTYRQLDRRANQLAHHLLTLGLGTGSRVGILLERSAWTYVSLLGVLKAGAAFVPIDAVSPSDRVGYICGDSRLDLVITSGDLAGKVGGACPVLDVDLVGTTLDHTPSTRPELPDTADPPAYVIYTSGSSGRPKGVEVSQSSICNFIDVVPAIYDVRESDRVYQGMSISFDFSIEEIWPTWAVGATLVAGPNDSRRLGEELAEFLDDNGVSVLYCVPTLLATIHRELPKVRSVLVGGEACPAELVERWSTPKRRILNTYGPTEATVTASWCELLPGRRVTIGRALPTYTVVLLDEALHPVPDGDVGEICIGGPGVANGYVGLPEKTADRFVEHPLAPRGGRLYRTGDLGRTTEDGEIEYLGRADAEVKIRGRRVDLGEIDNVLLEHPAVSGAVTALTADGMALASYLTVRGDAGDELIADLHDRARAKLPEYMVPALVDVLDELPTMPSGKVHRARLPAPSGRRFSAGAGEVVPPETDMQKQVAVVWAEVFGLDPRELSVDADFFGDLGGHSLLAANVVSALRERRIGGSPAVRDLYAHPTVRSLADHLDRAPAPAPADAPARRVEAAVHRRRRTVPAGLAQLAFLYVLLLVGVIPVALVYSRYDGVVGISGVLGELALAALTTYVVLRWVLPVPLARALAAGIHPGRYRLWGLTYLRLWALDLVLTLAPLPALSGSPLYAPYLRLLGARVGRRTQIATSAISLPTLLDIGDDASLGYDVQVQPWVVDDGWVVVEPIRVGEDAFVGSSTVLEPGASVGAGAGIAEHSAVGGRQAVPPQQWWAGSPLVEVSRPEPMVQAMAELPTAPGWRAGPLLGAAGGLLLLELTLIAMVLPSIVMVWAPLLLWGTLAGLVAAALVGPVFVVTVCVLVACIRRLVLPRTEIGIHHARSGLGVRKWIGDKLLESSLVATNSLYATLYTVPWLRMLGARVGRGSEVSTAAYFDPALLTLGEQSFVADMASIGSARFYNGYVGFARTAIGRRSFVGNAAFVPSGTSTGDGSLLGVHTVPPAAEVPAESSWLGSPAIFLPQRQSSGTFSERTTFRPPPRAVVERLAIEYFRVTMPASVLAVAVYLTLLGLSELAGATGTLATLLLAPVLFALGSVLVLLFVVALKWVLVGAYRPRIEPLWSRFVRRTELVTGVYEAAAVPALLGTLTGTPLLPPALRLLGTRIGKCAWIGTTYLTEFDLVHIGQNATVGKGVSLQTHLFEDRVMKMSQVRVGDGATVGERSIVLYDAEVGVGTALESLSLAMKGEQLTPGTRWRGIPAQGVL
ncbi:Pls/PosA family non-ribosomal peptide synthetase [Saccharopolyspora erythraea]|uniref:Non-ribosomal peptide synthetase n=1 Tax=Saccharopolyspora erythraea TaxID=1836 RepID=A0ABP3M636_SACER|nr:Pls/PosA family non-ribosomal peptide synthetase [Saccharopolyspora erythraea]EQD83547.1 peptide synthetase [Saccharopolyspora erythraea D]QRK92751.1 amino acid adenylation domain-containing protein [Saccharopolyspora erythraea]